MRVKKSWNNIQNNKRKKKEVVEIKWKLIIFIILLRLILFASLFVWFNEKKKHILLKFIALFESTDVEKKIGVHASIKQVIFLSFG